MRSPSPRVLLGFVAMIVALTGESSPSGAQTSGPVRYIYNEFGRLTGVVSGTGESATYRYDAVGNLLAITRGTAGQVSIIEFNPGSAPIGASVLIFGTGFSSTASQNTVTFNGLSAPVSSSTATQIVTSVPAGATTGPISVITPSGSATSATSFTVTAPTTPVISGFSPAIGSPGTAVTVTGSNFDPAPTANHLLFNNTSAMVGSATATTLTTSVPNGGSGRLSIATPYGRATSAADFYIPPGTHNASDLEVGERMTLNQSKTLSLGASGKYAMILFDAVGRSRVSLKVSGVSIDSSTVALYSPENTKKGSSAPFNRSGTFIDVKDLLTTGTYAYLVDPEGTYTGSATLTLYDVPPDLSGTMTIGGSALTVTTTAPGQNARFTFQGSAGQKVKLTMTGVTIASSKVSIFSPDGTKLGASPTIGTAGGSMTRTLSQTGPHAIVVDPDQDNIGSLTLSLTLQP